jgi:pimeloyl-ACP methyl ester carboxylesterase
MPTIVRDGTTLAYEERGTGEPALVFVHGWTCDRSFFAPQAEHFARRHRVVSVDLRGHGESDKPEGPYSIATFADDIAYLMERLGLGRAVVVGHSMGGITVLQLAAAHPDRVAAIVMVDPAPFSIPPEVRPDVEALIAAIAAGHEEPRRGFIVDRFFLPGSDPALVDRVLGVMMAAPPHVAAGALRAAFEFDAPAAAARCTAPALHIAATPPFNEPHHMSQWLPGVVNGWTVGAGHFNQLEAPEQVTSMIEGFLRHHAPGVHPHS